MHLIARVTVQSHEIDQHREHTYASQRVMHLYRVIGNSPLASDQICRRCADDTTLPPSVAITVEGIDSVGKSHIEVCKAIKKTCGALHRSFHLCGVTANNRKIFADAGLLDGIDRQNIHDSVAALLQSLSPSSPLQQAGQSRLKFPSTSSPFAPFLPTDTL